MSDICQKQRIECVQALHQSPTQIVAALSGGGTFFLSDLLAVPGGSRTLIEAAVPYSHESISNYIGRVPEQFCCSRTARTLAMTAFYHARKVIRCEELRKHGYVDIERVSPKTVDISHDIDGITESAIIRSTDFVEPSHIDEIDPYQHILGIGCTASLVTGRQKMGEHRVYVALQTMYQTIQFSLRLQKNARTRLEEERLVADLILNAVETARQETEKYLSAQLNQKLPHSNLESKKTHHSALLEELSSDHPLYERIKLPLKPGEVVLGELVTASPLLVDLFFGKLGAILWTNGSTRQSVARADMASLEIILDSDSEVSQAIFPGSFSPIHKGHLEMINIAEKRLGKPVVLEISVQNVDKPPIDYIDLERRLTQIARAKPDQAVWLTQTPLFLEKAELFQSTTFVVGADTIKRFSNLRFYQENVNKFHDILRTIAYYNCRFLVFARQSKTGLESLETLSIPDMLRSLCEDVPPSVFTMNISSSDLRREEVH